jgi:hypothetical protein
MPAFAICDDEGSARQAAESGARSAFAQVGFAATAFAALGLRRLVPRKGTAMMS